MGFLDALGGGIAAAADTQTAISMDQIKAQIEQDRQNAIASFNAELNLENQPKLEAARLQVQSEAAENARQAQVGRIEEAKQGLINQNMESQFGASDQAVAAAANGETIGDLTDEQKAVIQEGKGIARSHMENDRDIFIQAAIKTGDIKPEMAAQISSKADALLAKVEQGKENLALKQEIAKADIANQSAMLSLKQQIAQQERASGNVNTALLTTAYQNANTDINSATTQIGQLRLENRGLQSEISKASETRNTDRVKELKDQVATNQETIGSLQSRLDSSREYKSILGAKIGLPVVPVAEMPQAKQSQSATKAPYPDGTQLTKGGKSYVVRGGVPVPQ